MASVYEWLGYLCVLILFVKSLLYVLRFIYTSFLGDLLGHTPVYKNLGKWAVVTGATDGIGKAYACEFARRGLDIVLVSRTLAKLEAVSEEIKNKYSVQVINIKMDFTNGLSEYSGIRAALSKLDIAVLVNNVGMAHNGPEYFTTINSDSFSENIINCNILSLTLMTRIVLPQMKLKQKGVILNLSSIASVIVMPLHVQYSATKSYISQFSAGLQTELQDSGVIIQNIRPSGVCSNMTGFKKPNLLFSSASGFVQAHLKTVGLEADTFGSPSHKVQGLLASISRTLLPNCLVSKVLYSIAVYMKSNISK